MSHRKITEVEELDSLPTRTIIADAIHLPLRKTRSGWTYGKELVETEWIGLPAIVIWEP